jgi:hypothetical protein
MAEHRRVDFQHRIPLLGTDDPNRCVMCTIPADIDDAEMARVCKALRALTEIVDLTPLAHNRPVGSDNHDD